MPSMVSWEVSESQTMGLSALSDKNRAAKDPLEISGLFISLRFPPPYPGKDPSQEKNPGR